MSYRRWQTDGGDSESRACGEGGHAVSPEEEEASRFLSSLETGGDLTPWRRRESAGEIYIYTSPYRSLSRQSQ